MPYVVIEDWRGGVDRRRPIYAAPAGTLWNCKNAHITRGGDIEKRKAFADLGAFGEGTYGLTARGDDLYSFGSIPAGTVPANVTYVQLQHPAGVPMTELVDSDLFNGRVYALARFADAMVLHFYDGAIVADWVDGIVRADMSNNSGTATALAALIDASGTYAASAAANVITVTAVTAGTPFSVLTQADNGGATDDQTLTNANTVANVAAVAAVSAFFSFDCQGGAGAGTVTSVRVGGVECISGGPVAWGTSNTTFAAAIAANITAFAGTSGYTATSTGQAVRIAAVAAGIAANGLSVEVTTTGTARLGSQTAAGTNAIGQMAGGVAAVAAVAQVNTLTVGGTFEPFDRFGVRLQSGTSTLTTEYFGNYAKPWGTASCCKTHKRKVYVGAGSIEHFCAVNDATAWNVDTDPGAGFQNLSNHIGGSEDLLSLETYQGRLAAFARRAVQLWTMQDDDDLNNPDQFLENTGTRSPRSALEYGGNDVFYLDDSGIRSLKARDASNNAFVSDVGVAIDNLIREFVASGVTVEEIEAAVSIIDPVDGRFWMALSDRIFVYSFFPNVKISAWSWYEPGFVPEWMARTTNRVWIRSENTLYLYGGNSGDQYDESEVEVLLPFTTINKPGTFKAFLGMDIAGTGTWQGQWLTDPNNLNRVVQMGEFEGVTFPKAGIAGVGHATHIAPKMTASEAEYASLSQIALYYAGSDSKP